MTATPRPATIDGDAPHGAAVDDAPDAASRVGADLATIYEVIAAGAMRELPVYNPALRVEAVGFRRDGDRVVGIVATPWFMNLVVTAVPGGAPLPAAPAGASVTHGFAGGDFACVVGALDGFGRLDSASLFSPMFEFDDPAVVRAVAEAALAAIVTAPEPEPDPEPEPEPAAAARPAAAIDRRALLFGRRGGGEGAA